ncbi:unnamed protein product [Timema podura]|uniref:Ion transport domain-containing protein n=1 Tax=Timema podura TaxID=61482 RepID=A0ABN7PH61_TIMPD|nr:unnamed protein product [Timema podura]
MFETSQSLFWASFGLVDLMNFELTGIKNFTRFWAMLLFGSYSVINIIVLLNMLIAMMSNSYQIISEHSDKEWKFARSRLWMSYFEEGDTVPTPFNIIPTPKIMLTMLGCRGDVKNAGSLMKSRQKALERHDTVMHLLVRRYVTAEQTKRDDYGITEDDVMEIRQDISSLRYELVDILRQNGMKTPNIDPDTSIAGKKGRVMERRLQKDFQIGFVEGILKEVMSSEKEPKDVFSKIAKAIAKRTSSGRNKTDWNAMVRRSTMVRDPIGSAAEVRMRQSRQSLRRHIIANQSEALATMDPEKLLEYNPKLAVVSPAARVAYAKFKMSKIKQEYDKRQGSGRSVPGDTTEPGAVQVLEEHEQRGTSPSSIVRPRPRSSVKSQETTAAESGAPPEQGAQSTELPVERNPEEVIQMSSGLSSSMYRKDFRSRTPIPEDPQEEESAGGVKGEGNKSPPRSSPSTSERSKPPAPGKWL